VAEQIVAPKNGANNLTLEMNGTTYSAVRTFVVGNQPLDAVYDPQDGDVYVTNMVSDNLSIISDATNSVLGTIYLGIDPVFLTVNSLTGELYATNLLSGTISFVNPAATGCITYPVTFTESGLPSGTSWSVSVNGPTLSSSGTTLTVQEPNGTYNFTVGAVPGFGASPASGSVVVSGAPGAQGITFTRASPSLTSVAITPASALVQVGGTQMFAATPTCSGGPCPASISYSWVINNTLGTLSSNGAVTNFTAGSTTGTTRLNVTATLNGILRSSLAGITITPLPSLSSVSVSPSSASVVVNTTQSFTATPTCSGGTCPGGTTYSWSLTTLAYGTLSPATGPTTTFSAGAAPGLVDLFVNATLNGKTIQSPPTTITVTRPVPTLSSVSVSPTSITVGVGNSTSFSAYPNCTGGTCPSGSTYSWTLNNTALGTLSPSSGPTETFTAGTIAGSVILQATAYLNGRQANGIAIIYITKGPVPALTGLTLTPSPSITIQVGTSRIFNATASCTVTPCPSQLTYTWATSSNLGNLSSTMGISSTFTAGSQAGSIALTVTASLNGGSKQATSDITITTAVVPVISGVDLTPKSVTMNASGSQSFAATASCSPSPCPTSISYSWKVNGSLGSVNPTTGASVTFTAGSVAGTTTLIVNASFNGRSVTGSSIISIVSPPTPPPTNNTSPPTFLGFSGITGYLVVGILAAVIVAVVVVALTRRKKIHAMPSGQTGRQAEGEYPSAQSYYGDPSGRAPPSPPEQGGYVPEGYPATVQPPQPRGSPYHQPTRQAIGGPVQSPLCPTCGQATVYLPSSTSWYCNSCSRLVR